jgi:hypothetical protein
MEMTEWLSVNVRSVHTHSNVCFMVGFLAPRDLKKSSRVQKKG